MNKPNYYAILSAEVRYDKNLTPNAKLLYAEITALCNMNGQCFATNKYFSNLYGKSKISISKWISELISNGYIVSYYTYKKDSKEIDKRYLTIVKGGIKENINRDIKEKFKDNTINNNTNITYNNKEERFKKPTINQVKNYCIERNNNIDAEAFIAFYESKGWMVGSNKMKNWKQAIITWEKRETKKPTMGKLHSQINEWQEAKKLL
jgi:hypothetical protein